MFKEITSKENARVKYAYELKTSKGRKEHNQFLIEGHKSLELALKAGLVTDIFTTKKLKGISEDINQYLVSQEIIDKLAYSKSPEGVVFIANCIEEKEPTNPSKVVYLDHVSDPGNMGTIIRTALAFSYDAVCLSNNCVSIYNEKTIAASKGAIFLLPIYHKDIKEFDSSYKVIVSTLSERSIELDKVSKEDKFVLVLGNEAHGVSEDSIEKADILVKIPVNNIDSLNVSIAAGILMYHLK